jgi:hypothetical protein
MRNMMSAALIAAVALLGWSGGAVAVADSPCTALSGALQDDQTCNVHAATSTYTLDMTFPVDYPDQALTDFLTQNRDGFVNVAQTSSQTSGPREVPYQMEVTSEQFHSGQITTWPGRKPLPSTRFSRRTQNRSMPFTRSCSARWESRLGSVRRSCPVPV